jgi:hypothetical protein
MEKQCKQRYTRTSLPRNVAVHGNLMHIFRNN